MKREMNKRGISDVVTTILIVGLALVAIGVVWGVVSRIVTNSAQQANFQFGTFFLDISIQNIAYDSNGNLQITVSRGAGQGDLNGIAFVISDGKNSVVIKKNTAIQQLEAQTFNISSSELGAVKRATEIDIAPVAGGQTGGKADSKTSDPYSCLNILATGKSTGSGTYTIDPDGLGAEQSIGVYCDMTTDGGGWTLVQTTVKGQPADSRWAASFQAQLNTTIGTPSLDNPYRLAMKYWYIIPNLQWSKMGISSTEKKATFDKSPSFSLTGTNSNQTLFTYSGTDPAYVLNSIAGNWNTCTNGISYFNTACCGTCILFTSSSYNANNQPMMSTITATDGSNLQKYNGYVPLDRLNIFLR